MFVQDINKSRSLKQTAGIIDKDLAFSTFFIEADHKIVRLRKKIKNSLPDPNQCLPEVLSERGLGNTIIFRFQLRFTVSQTGSMRVWSGNPMQGNRMGHFLGGGNLFLTFYANPFFSTKSHRINLFNRLN